MAQFSRRTILAATDKIGGWSHTDVDRFLLEYSLEETVRGGSRADRANALGRFLISHPETATEDGENLTDSIITAVVQWAVSRSVDGYPREYSFEKFQESFPDLQRGLERDGFTVESGELRRMLPEALDLPKADDEVHALLDRYGFRISKTHLDQGIAAHARGDWEAANGQFRPFVEGLFDEIAGHLANGAALPPTSEERRRWLANRQPPFFFADLNEWNGQGTGFMQTFYRRLHPAGAHPGLSDEEDSTFRLHLVLVVARNVLRRLG